MTTREWNPPSLRFGATRMEDSRGQARSVLEGGGKRSATPLSEATGTTEKLRRRYALPQQSTSWRLALLLGFLILHSAFCLRAWGQSYSIDWYKISGGGGTSTGATYQVSGTIGQPDASQQAMTGGNYSLVGGFWAVYAVQAPGAPYLWVMRTTTNTVCVWWGVSGTSWQLQATNSLASPGSGWTACSYVTNGANCVYVESSPIGNRFYRLKHP